MGNYRTSVVTDSFISPLSHHSTSTLPFSSFRHHQQQQQHQPPAPPPPPFTKKLLEMMESGPLVTICSEERLETPPTTIESPTQALKHDLEDLIDYVDGLAFEATPLAKETITGRGAAAFTYPPSDMSNNNGIFRDRTNLRSVPATSNPMKKLFGGSSGGPTKSVTASNSRMHAAGGADIQRRAHNNRNTLEAGGHASHLAIHGVVDSSADFSKRQLEPAGSQPDREVSLYFHDESLSLILSQSEDEETEKANQDLVGDNTGDRMHEPKSSPRLVTLLQNSGVLLGNSRTGIPPAMQESTVWTPRASANDEVDDNNKLPDPYGTRSTATIKAISFLPVAKDPTPQKADTRRQSDRTAAVVTPFTHTHNSPPSPLETKDDHTPQVRGEWSNEVELESPYPHRDHRGFSSREHESDHELNEEDHTKIALTPSNNHMVDPTLLPRQFLGNSPESAKKLLQTAIEALKDARQERQAARQWANDMKEAVHQWVEEQRQLIRTESSVAAPSTADASTQAMTVIQQQLEESIQSLHQEIAHSNSSRKMLQNLLLKQDEQIRTMSVQLTAMTEKLGSIVEAPEISERQKFDAPQEPRRLNPTPPTGNSVPSARGPRFVDTTPKLPVRQRQHSPNLSGQWSSTSTACSQQTGTSSRVRRRSPNGGHVIEYGNGVTKEVHPDGTTVTRFSNGDVETKFPDASSPREDGNKDVTNDSSSQTKFGIVAYFHCKEGILQITQRDGSTLYEYPNGQIERHYDDGTIVILFPDGTKNVVIKGKSSWVE